MARLERKAARKPDGEGDQFEPCTGPTAYLFNQSVARGLARIQYKKPHPSLRSLDESRMNCFRRCAKQTST